MQEEVTQKTVTFCIRTTKVTADLLKKVLAAYLRHQKQKSVEKKAKKIRKSQQIDRSHNENFKLSLPIKQHFHAMKFAAIT